MTEHSNLPAHGAEHAHAHDRGIGAFFRYVSFLPKLWRSEVSRDVVLSIAPRAGERVVDLGAGLGAATVVAADSGANVVAVDPTSYMRCVLGFRRRWLRHGSLVTVMDGAAESIPLADSSVDALWTVNTVHHWTDKPAACREIARVMRPKGRVLLVDEDFDDPAHPEHQRHQALRARHHFQFDPVNPEELAKSLRDCGFASAQGMKTTFAGRPAKVLRATR